MLSVKRENFSSDFYPELQSCTHTALGLKNSLCKNFSVEPLLAHAAGLFSRAKIVAACTQYIIWYLWYIMLTCIQMKLLCR